MNPAIDSHLPSVPWAPRTLSHARRATRAQFAGLGLCMGMWGVHIPSLKAQYGLHEGTLALVLLSMALGALLSLSFAGRVVNRLGVARTCAMASTTMAVLFALALLWPGLGWLLPAMLVCGAAQSLLDVAINAEGTTLEVLGQRPVMSQLHGMFSVGGMAGAALGAALIRAGMTPEHQLALTAAAVVLMSLLAVRHMLPIEAHQEDSDAPQTHFTWPRGVLLLIGLLIFAGMTAEGVMYDWSVLYLKQELGMTQDLAAVGYAAFAGAMALARLTGDALRARQPAATLLRGGALLTGVAMAVVLISGVPWLSMLGYICVGAGLALVVPMLYNAASQVPGTSRAAAIASVSSIGYAGFLIGPPLIGAIAHAASLTWAMGVIVVAAALLAWGSGRIGLKTPQKT